MPNARSPLSCVLLAALLAGSAVSLTACGDGRTSAEATRTGSTASDAEATRVLDAMRDFYRRVERVEGRAVSEHAVQGQRALTAVTFAAERPNRVAIALSEDGAEISYAMVSGGQQLSQYVGEPLHIYSQEPAPASYTGMLAAAAMGSEDAARELMAVSPHLLVLGLLGGEGFDQMVRNARQITLVGTEDIEGQKHTRVRLHGSQLNLDLWIAAGEKPWLTRLVPDPSPMMADMIKALGDRADEFMASQPKITLSFQWSSPEQIAGDAFAFEPPEGIQRVESIARAVQTYIEEQQEQLNAPPLAVGSTAPAMDLELLSGGKATLADHQGKIVILDFWATWCGPCVRALPIITSVASRYKDQGVVFYAVNVQENPETIRGFLEQHKLDIAVPLDRDADVAQSYGVRGIPQTVIIGKDGTVQAVHVGLLPNLEEQLSRELETLIAGNTLAPAVTPEGPG
jgi:thiol-disulfide isomerase/thioredoxin